MTELLERVYLRNTVQDYLIALGIILLGFIATNVIKRVVLTRVIRWTSRTTTHIDDFIVSSINRFGIPAFYITAVYIGINYLTLTLRLQNIFRIAITVAVTFLIIRLISSTILLVLKAYVRHQDNGIEKVKQLGGIMLIINIIVWGIGLLFLFDNLGYDVTAIIAGLGIGGIAIALAAQNILGDLFNYFVIFFDRPIETGDFIVVDEKNGIVDYIGIKTTRVKTLSGEQLVFSNSDLMNSRIHNFKRMEQRRIVFKLGVTYQTSLDNIKRIPQIIKSVIEEQSPVRFDRSHFQAYGDSSLDFETVYFILDPEYNKYMDIQQAINIRIFEEFEKSGVDFAYPTRTLFLSAQHTEDKNNLKK
ncbi:mechanosensitive ion channel family protein [Adhaeribacter aquaticus]|uniref:mechanosensitive ion channel family protein n=1 Tax=Adhaeribacter aquaticus TaxID=299567 RepID=UPI0004057AD8|nr:mechanosensitive ion channel domain-containing protein [Adhaeribacter aquaticus]